MSPEEQSLTMTHQNNNSVSVGYTNEKTRAAISLIKTAANAGLAEANSILGQIYEIGGFEN